jgi:hypothetical protein
MGFVDRELERVTTKLQAGPLTDDERGQLYAVQQALLWALEPDSFKRPYDMIIPPDNPQDLADCPAENGRSASSDILDCHVS